MAHIDLPGRRVVSPALVGRSAELTLAAAAAAAPPSVVVIDGEAGVGKTRLVGELAHHPELAGRRLLIGRCHGIRESFPLGPMVEALRHRGKHFAAADWSPVVGALRPLLPEVADSLPPAPMPLDDRGAERHRVFRALVEVLGALGPAVLVLEDMHWADQQTVDFVCYLLAEACPELAVVLTLRGDEADPWVRALTSRLPRSIHRTDVVLRPLDRAQTGALTAAIVGTDQVSDEFAGYLHERTSGLPLAIEELLALLHSSGGIVHQGGQWTRRRLDELDVPSGIRDPVLERVSRLSGAARSVMEAAAVLQVPVSLETLEATCRPPRDQTRAGVEESVESGLLVEHGDSIGFRHLLAAQAVYDEIPGPRRRDLHARAAEVLEVRQPAPLGQIAHHLRRAGGLSRWVDAAERAAYQALALGNDAEAFRLLEEILRHATLTPDRRGRLAVLLGQSALDTLRTGEVLDVLAEALTHEMPAPVRGELRFQMALTIHESLGDPQRVQQLMSEAIGELQGRPELQAWAMITLGLPETKGTPLAEHHRWLMRALEVVPQVHDASFEVLLLAKIAMVLIPMGDPIWRSLTDRIAQRTGGTPHHRREVNAFWSVGAQAGYVGEYPIADRLLTSGLSRARAIEHLRLAVSTEAALVLLRFFRGQWHGLREEGESLIGRLAEHPRARTEVELALSCLRLAQGEAGPALQALRHLVEQAFAGGAFDVLSTAVAALLRAATVRGDSSLVAGTLDRWLRLIDARGLWAADMRALPVVAATLVDLGRQDELKALLERCEQQLRDLDAPLAPASLDHSWGIWHRAAGELVIAAQRLATAADQYEQLGCPYEAALATEEQAACLLWQERAEAGAEALRRALAALRHLGAEWDQRRVASMARQHRVAVPARHRGGRRGYGGALSPREREVATLAAMGRSNKEIAAELYLSVYTVGRHISSAMKKLDARSRTALAHRLGGTGGEEDLPA